MSSRASDSTEPGSDRARAEDCYDRGLAELHRYLFHFESESLPRAVEAFRAAAELSPERSSFSAGLGFALDASDLPEEALAAFRRARDLDPYDEAVDVYVATLLSDVGPESAAVAEVEALAERRSVDLQSLRIELIAEAVAIDARTLLMNGFIHARNFLRSRLEDEIEHLRRKQNPRPPSAMTESEQDDCVGMQQDLPNDLDPERVPMGLRDVTPWAVRIGVGDDVCRGRLFEKLTSDERREVLDVVEKQAPSIHAWLDTFRDKAMTGEAAAFMYLLLGIEETS